MTVAVQLRRQMRRVLMSRQAEAATGQMCNYAITLSTRNCKMSIIIRSIQPAATTRGSNRIFLSLSY